MTSVELNSDQTKMIADAARRLPDHILAACALPHVLGYLFPAPPEAPSKSQTVERPPTLTVAIIDAIKSGATSRKKILAHVGRMRPGSRPDSVDAVLSMLKQNNEIKSTGPRGRQRYSVA